MEAIIGWLVVGIILLYLGIGALIEGPIDNRITSIVGRYIMAPIGFLVLLRGLYALASLKDMSRKDKWRIGICYPMLTLGVLLCVFNWIAPPIREGDIQLLATNWPSLAAGSVLIVIGYVIRMAIHGSNPS
jgi:hypothetical protein